MLLNEVIGDGIRDTTLSWFKNYLSNRKQFTVLADAKSDILNIACGVP